MKPIPLLLLAAEAGEKLTVEERYRLKIEADRAKAYARRLAAVAR